MASRTSQSVRMNGPAVEPQNTQRGLIATFLAEAQCSELSPVLAVTTTPFEWAKRPVVHDAECGGSSLVWGMVHVAPIGVWASTPRRGDLVTGLAGR